MNDKERLVTAQWVFERTLGWIAAAEIKVGVVVTLNIALLGGLAAAFSGATSKCAWGEIFALIAGAASIAALVCAAAAVMPRLGGPTSSLLFFGRISSLPASDFIKKFREATDAELLLDWTSQIHRNSVIAATKHLWVKRAMGCSFFSTVPWLIAIAFFVKP
jgi:hypothetical protein